MALQSGRYATVKIGTVSAGTIPFLGKWEVQITSDSADATYFGSVWKYSMPMMSGWTWSVDGYFDNSTVSTQLIMLSSGMMKAAFINNIRFYIDTSSGVFFMPNYPSSNSTDAGAYVTNYRVTADKAGITAVSMSGVGAGPLALFATSSDVVVASSTS